MKTIKFWLIAAVIGAIVAVVMGDLAGIAAGVSVFVILGVVLTRMLGGETRTISDATVMPSETTTETESKLADTRPEDIAVKEDEAVMAAIQEQIVETEVSDVDVAQPVPFTTATQTSAGDEEAPEADEVTVYTDDLTMIEGLPEKFAMGLHEIGITTFDQIAAWTDDDINEVTEKLGIGRKHRIANQNWVEQAQALLEKGA